MWQRNRWLSSNNGNRSLRFVLTPVVSAADVLIPFCANLNSAVFASVNLLIKAKSLA
ncbi:hypothetical protein BBOR36S_00223 [Brevibacillus borstelensis]